MRVSSLKRLEKETPEVIIESLGIDFSVNDWGSCQYTGALNAFNALNKLTKKFGEKKAFELLKVKFSHGKKRTQKEASKLLLGNKHRLKYAKEDLRDEKRSLKFYEKMQAGGKRTKKEEGWWVPDNFTKTIKQSKERIKGYEKDIKGHTMNGDQMFNWAANQAWDLWSAAPVIADIFFEDFKVDVADAPGQGPILNALVQSDNYRTGAICWYLMKKGIVKNEKSFAGFDT